MMPWNTYLKVTFSEESEENDDKKRFRSSFQFNQFLLKVGLKGILITVRTRHQETDL